ncbi:probable Bax inhibitor 1 [Oscarella lobularis]|uniref:probable Bax inhibitor 1 n=1 Tax=Oscarella lobularis TaxID=121494 RepID=UPI003313688C
MNRLLNRRGLSLKTLTDFSSLEDSTRKHLKNVYSCLSLSMLAAAGGSAVHLGGVFRGGILASLVSFGFLMALMFTKNSKGNSMKRMGFLMGFAACTGLGLGPILDFAVAVDPSIIPTAFLGTCVIFASFTLSALWAKQRSYLYMGGTLFSCLNLLMLAGLINLFARSTFLFNIQLYGGLALMCAFVLFDTQLIVEKRRSGDDDFIWHSVDLFIDFIDIFRRLVIILGMNKKKNNKD